MLCRPAGATLFHHMRHARDVSLGGARVYSDDSFEVGSRLDLDVILPDRSSVRCWAVVAWVVELESGEPARFDVGLSFTDMEARDVQRLAAVLGPAG